MKTDLRAHFIAGLVPLSGFITGLVTFIIFYGSRIVNVRYIDWMLEHVSHDPPKNYLGWSFYRNNGWNFPLGIMENFGYPFGTTIIQTDSIPLLAILCKLFDPVLPVNFQYFGLWGMISFGLQGLFAALIIKKWTGNPVIIILSALFFILSPPLIYRMFIHTALASGHWLILAAIYLFISNVSNKRRSIILWVLLHSISILVHPYIAAMVFFVFCGYLINRYLADKDKNYLVRITLINVFTLLAISWIIGVFAGETEIMGSGLGKLSMNLNALINPEGWSRILPALPYAYTSQNEGFMYLGTGMLLIVLISFFISCFQGWTERNDPRFKGVLFVLLACLLLSLSPVITFNQFILFEYPRFVSRYLLRFWHLFHASGRLFWPAYYMVFAWGLYKLLSGVRKQAVSVALLSFLLLIQIFDLSAGFKALQSVYRFREEKKYENTLHSALWTENGGRFKHMVLLPPADFVPVKNPYQRDYEGFAFYASQHDMTLNTGYFARSKNKKINKHGEIIMAKLRDGSIDDNTLYVFREPALLHSLESGPGESENITVRKIGQFVVFFGSSNKPPENDL